MEIFCGGDLLRPIFARSVLPGEPGQINCQPYHAGVTADSDPLAAGCNEYGSWEIMRTLVQDQNSISGFSKVDVATVVGLILGSGLVVGSILFSGSLTPFVNVPSLMITVGGSIAAVLITFPLKKCLSVFGVVRNCFMYPLPTETECIKQFKEFATIVRRDGILALEQRIEDVDDSFLKRGAEMVIAGNSREDIQSMLEIEVMYIEQRHQSGKKIVTAIASAAPAFGMIGTLIGLVQMLRSLEDPSQIGVGMATALLTTLYGAVIANLFCIPLAGKLETRSQEEVLIRELMIVGLLGLVEGQTPRNLEDRLVAFVSPAKRESEPVG